MADRLQIFAAQNQVIKFSSVWKTLTYILCWKKCPSICTSPSGICLSLRANLNLKIMTKLKHWKSLYTQTECNDIRTSFEEMKVIIDLLSVKLSEAKTEFYDIQKVIIQIIVRIFLATKMNLAKGWGKGMIKFVKLKLTL